MEFAFSCSSTPPAGLYTVFVTVCDLPDYGGECLSDEDTSYLPGPELPATVAMQLDLIGTAISTDGNYSEDSTIQVTAVDASTGQPLTDFTGTVTIGEAPPPGEPAIYNQNGGSLVYGSPTSSVTISSGGTATFLARSLAGPTAEGPTGQPPPPAIVTTTNYPLYLGNPLTVQQWIITEIIDPLADLTVPDNEDPAGATVYNWLQARIHDMFTAARLGDQNLSSVLGTVLGYGIDGSSHMRHRQPQYTMGLQRTHL